MAKAPSWSSQLFYAGVTHEVPVHFCVVYDVVDCMYTNLCASQRSSGVLLVRTVSPSAAVELAFSYCCCFTLLHLSAAAEHFANRKK